MPTTVESLLILSLVLTPGFLFTLVITRTIAHLQASELRFILTIVAMGTIIHGIVFPWSVRVIEFHQDDLLLDHWIEVYAWGLIAIFALPVGLGVLLGRLSRRPRVDRFLERFGFSYVDRLPSAWDFVLLEKRGFYVRVYLKDDQGILGGVYGRESFASTDPRLGDLFIQELWELDDTGKLIRPNPHSRGAWIARDTMSFVEFLAGTEEPDELETGAFEPESE